MRKKRWFLIVILIFGLLLKGSCQDKKTLKRIEYLKNAPLLVSLPVQDPKELLDKSPDEIVESTEYFNSLNNNIRLVMRTFWDLSAEIIYISIDSIKPLMKSRKEAIFLLHEVKVYGNKKENEKAVLSFSLVKPNKSVFFDAGTYFLDSGFIEISNKFRLFRQSVLGEDVWSSTKISDKSIVYLENTDNSVAAKEYLADVKANYRTRVQEISRHDLVNLILTSSSKHILVFDGNAYYLQDGKMVALIY
jgi:hypothetical protein